MCLRTRILGKNGEVFPGEVGVFYQKDVYGQVLGRIGLIRNVDERLRMEEKLRKSCDSVWPWRQHKMASMIGIY